MNDFPERYGKEYTDKEFAKLNMSEEKIKLLGDYFSAFSNFYERISLKRAIDIIIKQNEGVFTREQIIAFSEVVRHQDGLFYLIIGKDEMYDDVPVSKPEEREIVHESLVDVNEDEYYELVELQEGKPLFIPDKDDLLKYADDFYYERNEHTEALREFLTKSMKLQAARPEDIIDDIDGFVHIGAGTPFESIFDNLYRMGIRFEKTQFNEFVPLLKEIVNNTRVPYHRGHTQKEISEIAGEISIDDIFEEFMLTYPIERLIKSTSLSDGRNKPCPCGSGKKYKNCCGRHLKGT